MFVLAFFIASLTFIHFFFNSFSSVSEEDISLCWCPGINSSCFLLPQWSSLFDIPRFPVFTGFFPLGFQASSECSHVGIKDFTQLCCSLELLPRPRHSHTCHMSAPRLWLSPPPLTVEWFSSVLISPTSL